MKKNSCLCLSLILLLFSSCEGQRTSRTSVGRTSTALSFNSFSNPSQGIVSGNTTSTTTDTNTQGATTGTTSNPAVLPEISHCSFSADGSTGYQNLHEHLSPDEATLSEGGHTVCQSSANELDVYIQLQNPITETQVCLVPTYNNQDNIVFIGQPRCLNVPDNREIYRVNLIKDRAGYTQFPVTGVMVMRDRSYFYEAPFFQFVLSPDAFIFCGQWLAQFGDPSYCIAFRDGGNFVYRQF